MILFIRIMGIFYLCFLLLLISLAYLAVQIFFGFQLQINGLSTRLEFDFHFLWQRLQCQLGGHAMALLCLPFGFWFLIAAIGPHSIYWTCTLTTGSFLLGLQLNPQRSLLHANCILNLAVVGLMSWWITKASTLLQAALGQLPTFQVPTPWLCSICTSGFLILSRQRSTIPLLMA